MSQGAELAVDDGLDLSIALGRDDRSDAAILQVSEDGVVAFVAHEHVWRRPRLGHDRRMVLDVGDLAAGEDHRDRQALAVGPPMDLGRKATARAAKTLVLSAPFLGAGGMLVGAHDGALDPLHAALALASMTLAASPGSIAVNGGGLNSAGPSQTAQLGLVLEQFCPAAQLFMTHITDVGKAAVALTRIFVTAPPSLGITLTGGGKALTLNATAGDLLTGAQAGAADATALLLRHCQSPNHGCSGGL